MVRVRSNSASGSPRRRRQRIGGARLALPGDPTGNAPFCATRARTLCQVLHPWAAEPVRWLARCLRRWGFGLARCWAARFRILKLGAPPTESPSYWCLVYLNYTYYIIIILKDAYGCWSLTVHGCVNIHIVVKCGPRQCTRRVVRVKDHSPSIVRN